MEKQSAIVLATEYDDVLLLLDDLKARKLATRLKFKITGTLGVIHRAKQMSLIDKINCEFWRSRLGR